MASPSDAAPSVGALLTKDNVLFVVLVLSAVHLLAFGFWIVKVTLSLCPSLALSVSLVLRCNCVANFAAAQPNPPLPIPLSLLHLEDSLVFLSLSLSFSLARSCATELSSPRSPLSLLLLRHRLSKGGST